MSPRKSYTRSHKKGRLEAFSDGVFAIAITLLVLDIVVPHVRGTELLHEIWREREMMLAYFVAFMTIGAVWIEHSALVDGLERIDGAFMRLNLVLLLVCAFLPFPTRLMGEYAGDRSGERVAVVFFGLVLLLQTVMLYVLARHAERENLFGSDVADEEKEESRLKYQLAPSLIFYAVAAGLGLLFPYLGLALYLLIAVYLAIPIATVRRLIHKQA
jgi:uncharacterized membrane protein